MIPFTYILVLIATSSISLSITTTESVTNLSIIKATNELRASLSLLPLKIDDRLMKSASQHVRDLASQSSTSMFGSNGDSFRVRLKKHGLYGWRAAGETRSIFLNGSTDSIMKSILENPSDRERTLSSVYTHIGVGT